MIQTVLVLTAPKLMAGIYIMYTNNFIGILGVVFATVWTSRQNWVLRAILHVSRPMSSIHFRPKSEEDTVTAFDPDEELGFWPP
jgi:hypothetical protein